MQVDLDDKTIVLPTRRQADPDADKPIKRGSRRASEEGGGSAAADQPTGESAADEAHQAKSDDVRAKRPVRRKP